MLRSLFWKHDLDDRINSHDRFFQQLSTTYFPLIFLMIDNYRRIQISNPSDKIDWMMCLTWILKNCDKKIIRQWWCLEEFKNIELFLKLLLMITPTLRVFFKY